MDSESSKGSTSQPTGKRASVATNLMHYVPSLVFRNIIGVLNTLIRPKLIGPQGFGLWSLLNVIPAYARHLQLGSRLYMRYEIPRLQAVGRNDQIPTLEASVYVGTMAPNIGVAIALLIVAAVGTWDDPAVGIGLAAMAAFIVLSAMVEHRITVFKGHQMYRELSRMMYFRNTAQLLLSTVLMLQFGLYGLFAALCISQLLVLLFLRLCHPVRHSAHFSASVYFSMIRQGLPLAINGFLLTMMITTGRLLVVGYLSTEEVGFYALASMVQQGMLQLPGAAREVIEPRIMEQAHCLEQERVLNRYLFRPLLLNACYLPLMIAPAFFLLPVLIEWVLPRYLQSIAPLQITLFGFYFLSVSFPIRSFLTAHGLQKQTVLCTLITLVANILLSLAALEAGLGITGVTTANCIGYAILILSMASLLRWKRGIRFPLQIIWPVPAAFLLLCVSVWIANIWLLPLVGGGWIGAALSATVLFGSGVFLITISDKFIPLLKGMTPIEFLKIFAKKAGITPR